MSTSQTVAWPGDGAQQQMPPPLLGEGSVDRATPPLSPRPRALVCGGLTKIFSEKRGETE